MRYYDYLIKGSAYIGAATLVFMTLSIVVDVMLRNLGFHPMQWTSAVVEYLMLFVTMAGAPWLVRTQGHIAVDSFVSALPALPQAVVSRAILLLSVLVLALLSWRSGAVGFEEYQFGSTDIRSIDIPAWVLYAMQCGGFGLTALECLRLLAGLPVENIHQPEAGPGE